MAFFFRLPAQFIENILAEQVDCAVGNSARCISCKARDLQRLQNIAQRRLVRDTGPPAQGEQAAASGDVCHLAGHRVAFSQAENLSPKVPFCCIFLTVGGLFSNVTYVLSGILPSLGVYL